MQIASTCRSWPNITHISIIQLLFETISVHRLSLTPQLFSRRHFVKFIMAEHKMSVILDQIAIFSCKGLISVFCFDISYDMTS